MPGALVTWTSTPQARLSSALGSTVVATGASGGSAMITAISDDAVATATLLVKASSAPVVGAATFTIATNGVLTVPAPGVLGGAQLGAPSASVVSFGGGALGGTVASFNAGRTVSFSAPSASAVATDTNGDTAKASQISGLGSVTLNADGSFTITPPPGFDGTFTFQYRIGNAIGTSDGTVIAAVDAPPRIVATAPVNDAVAVQPTASLSLTFSEPVTASVSAFRLECPTGTPVPFTMSGSGTTTLTLTPTSPLTRGASCRVTVVAAQVRDADPDDGPDTMAEDYSFAFTVEANSAPQAVNDSYAMNAGSSLGVPAPGVLNGDVLGVPAGVVTSFGGGTLGGTVTSNAAGATVTVGGGSVRLDANGRLDVVAPGASGSITFQYRVTNAAGSSDATVTIGFDARPAVVSTTPANGAVGVLAGSTITVRFSEPVTAQVSSFALQCPAGLANARAFAVSGSGTTDIVLTPALPLPSNTACSMRVLAGGIADVDAFDPPDGLAADIVVAFSVGAPPAPVNDTYVTPVNTPLVVAAPGVLTGDVLGAPAATLTLFGGGSLGGTVTSNVAGSNVAFGGTGSVQLNADGSLTVTPPNNFTGAITFQYRLTNISGTADALVTVRVEAAPSVTLTTPANGALNVATGANIDVTFSEPVSLAGNWIQVVCTTSGTRNASDFVVSGGPAAFTLNPNVDFSGGELCAATIFAAQVSDVDADDPPNNLAANVVFSFTAEAAPAVTSTLPVNGATGVATNSAITINFSEPVTALTAAFTVECPVGSARAFTVGGSGTATLVLTPTSALPAGTLCTVTVLKDEIHDVDATDPPDGLAANFVFSFATPLTANNDTYPQTVIGNVGVNSSNITPTSYSVTANDLIGSPVTITAFDATSVQGGTVTMTTNGAGIGQFTYNPPVGYEGNDSFTYTITNATGSATATVSLTVGGMVWFINNSAGACVATCNGRLSNPFTSLAAFQAVNIGGGSNPATGDNIFLYESATDYAGGVVLLDNQRLIGQDATVSLAAITGLTPPSGSAPFPAMDAVNGTVARIVNAAGHGVRVVPGNRVQGLTLGTSAAHALTGLNFGTLVVRDVAINSAGQALALTNGTLDVVFSSVSSSGGTNNVSFGTVVGTADLGIGALSGATSDAFVVIGASPTITYSGSIANSAAMLVRADSRSGGTLTFAGNLNAAGGTGIIAQLNTGGTVTFSGVSKTLSTGANAAVTLVNNAGAAFDFTNGGLVLTTSSAAGFTATGGGTVTVQGGGNTIVSTTGVALNVASTTIGAAGLTYQSISANGAPSGIILNNTGASGSLSVTGTGAANSGGTIQNTTGDGVSLTSTLSPSLAFLTVSTTGGHGVAASGMSGLMLSGTTISAAGNGDNEHGLSLTNVSGTVAINGATFSGASENLVHVSNTNTSLVLNVGTVSASTFSFPGAVGGFANGAIVLFPEGTSAITANIQGNSFTNIVGAAVSIAASAVGSNGTSALSVTNNSFTATLAARATNVTVNGREGTTTSVAVTGNTFTGAGGNNAIGTDASGTATVTGTIANNQITNPPSVGILVAGAANARMIVNVNNNTVANAGGDGIGVANFANGGTTVMDVSVTNNTVNGNSNSAAAAFLGGITVVSLDDSPGDVLRFTLRGNNVTGTNAGATQCGGAACKDYSVMRLALAGTVLMEEVPDTGDTVATIAFVQATNSPVAASVRISGTVTLSNGVVTTIVP